MLKKCPVCGTLCAPRGWKNHITNKAAAELRANFNHLTRKARTGPNLTPHYCWIIKNAKDFEY
jgi:hypothetical protein